MPEPIEAYPLTWPANRPRQQNPQQSRFKVTLGQALAETREEVRRLGGTELIISSNLRLRPGGTQFTQQAQPRDQGVAVYFTYKRKPMCFACDRWRHVEDNVRAIAYTIEALRGIERWGSGQMVEQAFTGFTALPAPEQPWQVLKVGANATQAEVDYNYKRLAFEFHPDRCGGDDYEMKRVNTARDELYRDKGWS